MLSLSTIKRAELGKPVSYRTALNFARFYDLTLETLEIKAQNPQYNTAPPEVNSSQHGSEPAKKTKHTPTPTPKTEPNTYVSSPKTTDHLPQQVAEKVTVNDQQSSDTVFFGRHYELMQFRQALQLCKQHTAPYAFYVRGMAGIGKSSFIEQCEQEASQQQYVAVRIENNTLNDAGWLYPVRELVQQLLLLLNANTVIQRTEQLQTIATQHALDDEALIQLYIIFNLPLPSKLRPLHQGMSYADQITQQTSLIHTLIDALQTPLLIAVEDLHFAPENFLQLLKNQLGTLENQSVIFVFSARLENDPLDALWRSHILSTPFITLDLSSLSTSDALSMADSYHCDDPQYREHCLSLSKGNPLFLQQLLMCYPQRVGMIPTSIRQLCESKFKALSPDSQTAISIASLIGEQVDHTLICYVMDVEHFSYTELLHQHLLIADRNHYRFYHNLVRESIHQLVSAPNKVKWHKKIAQWYQASDSALSAQHLSKAHHNLAPKAFIAAAEELIEQYNYADALNLVDKALLLALTTQQAQTLLTLKGKLLERLELPEKAIRYYHAALEKGVDTELHFKLAQLYRLLTRTEEEQEHIQQVQHLLKQQPNPSLEKAFRLHLRSQRSGSTPLNRTLTDNAQRLSIPSELDDLFAKQAPLSVPPSTKQSVSVGILHSQTGFLKELESGVLQCTLLAINEINNNGGLLGHHIHPVIVDGQSDDHCFAEGARQLVNNPDIVGIFGCSTSSSRKQVKPIIEQHKHLLVYPFQYEGIETSQHIAYVGPAPNQQAIPAVDWLVNSGKQRFLLVGSDYVYPRVTNKILRQELENWHIDDIDEYYIPLSGTDFSGLKQHIRQTKPDAIVSTVVGFKSNKALLQTLHELRTDSEEDTPLLMSLVLSEDDLISLPRAHISGIHTVFSYFQNIDDTINDDFVRRFKNTFGVNRRIGGYMESAYAGVNLWAKAVQKVEDFSPTKVMQAMRGASYYAPGGMVYLDEENNHVWRKIRIAKVDSNREYQILWESEHPIRPSPYPDSLSQTEWETCLTTIQRHYQGNWSNTHPSEAMMQ